MMRTRAAGLRTAGIGAVALAAGLLAILGVTGQAKAATDFPDVYCYKNLPGAENPDRIHISHVGGSGPDADGLYTLTWRSETEIWVKLGDTYTNPTFVWSNRTVHGFDSLAFMDRKSNPDTACNQLSYGTDDSEYAHGVWG